MPSQCIVPRYTDAQDAIARYIASPTRDRRILTRAVQRLAAATPRTFWDHMPHADPLYYSGPRRTPGMTYCRWVVGRALGGARGTRRAERAPREGSCSVGRE